MCVHVEMVGFFLILKGVFVLMKVVVRLSCFFGAGVNSCKRLDDTERLINAWGSA